MYSNTVFVTVKSNNLFYNNINFYNNIDRFLHVISLSGS